MFQRNEAWVLALLPALLSSCTQPKPAPEGASPPAVARKAPEVAVPPKPRDTSEITGTLVNKNGAPLADKVLVAYPLDSAGKPIFLSAAKPSKTPGMSTIETWNPQGKTGPDGRFSVAVPYVARIGSEEIREFGLSLEGPAGGWAMGTVTMIEYATPGKGPDQGFRQDVAGLKLLRQGNQVIKVKVDAGNPAVEVGKIVVE